jgi:hypothetical protein
VCHFCRCPAKHPKRSDAILRRHGPPWTFSQGKNSCSKARLQAGPGSFPSVQVFNQRALGRLSSRIGSRGCYEHPPVPYERVFYCPGRVRNTSAICQMAWLSFMSSSMPFRKVEKPSAFGGRSWRRGEQTAALLKTIAVCEPASMNISQGARMEDFPEMFVSPGHR